MNPAPPARPRSTPTAGTHKNQLAQKQTEGKAASSRNRLLHGLRANKHILLDEDSEEFLLLVHDHLDRFRPIGPAEEKLVLRIANDPMAPGPRLPLRSRHLPRPLPRCRRQGRTPPAAVHFEERVRRRGRRTGAAAAHAARRGRPPGPRLQPGLRGSQLLRQARPLRRQHRALNRPLPPPVGKVPGCAQRHHPRPGPPTQPAAGRTPRPRNRHPKCPGTRRNALKNKNYHSNPKNGGIARAGVPAGSAATFPILLAMLALLRAVPGRIAALASLLTDPPIEHKRREMNTFHRLAAALQQVRQSLPLPKGYGDGRQPTASILCVPTLAPNP